MVTTENKVLAISGNENGDSSGLFNHAHEMGDDPITSNQSSSGQDLNLGIVNQFGQLMGEYSWLDDELWLPKFEDDDAVELCNQGLKCDIVSSHKNIVVIDQPSAYVDNSVSDGGLDPVKEKSSSLKDSSQNQSETSSPVSVLQRKRSYSNIRTATCSQQPTEHNSLQGLQFLAAAICTIEQDRAFQSDSEYSMESSQSDEAEEYIPSKQVRTKKISELLDFNCSDRAVKKCMHCETTETPQWRTGPMGRKTLCNACGVQYKHGRLFSNYRPLRSPTFNPSLHFNLPKKVQEIRMGYTSGKDPNPTPKGPTPKKVKESDPNYTPKPKKIQRVRFGNSCERDTNLTPKLKKVEKRMDNNIDLNQTIASESERDEEMTLDNNDDLSLKLTPETESVQEMSLVNDSERVQNRAHRAKNFEEMREKASNLLESDSYERNKNCDSNLIIEGKLVTKVKKCTHCESTETPQWREGPMGRHTLCNACGVQYRAGRLFPEYRPLKSPTYDPLLHSHLPKKVLEMRMRDAEKCATSDICQDAV